MAKKKATKKKRVKKKAARPAKGKSAATRKKATRPKKKPAKVIRKKKPAPTPKRAAPKRASAATLPARIKSLDKSLVKLLNERADLTIKQILTHEDPRAGLFDLEEERDLWQRLGDLNKGPLPPVALRSIYREVLSAARSKIKTARVAYLGPQYSFTHLAAIERFGTSADLIPVNTIAAVFEEVNRGHAEYGIVPIENSTDGRIVDTLDMFTRLPLRICGEVQMAVHHYLLSRSPRGEVVEIYSKPQAISQCRDWLARNMPRATLHEVTSTSTAAQLARDKPGAAAIASRQAAVQYELEVLAEQIQDNIHNITRFAVIGDEVTKPTGKDRTALLLQISHKPGSLSEGLQAFKKGKINLTWIESFPLRGPEVGYLFFLDFEGHRNETRVKNALAELEKNAVRMEVLGSYPRSEPID